MTAVISSFLRYSPSSGSVPQTIVVFFLSASVAWTTDDTTDTNPGYKPGQYYEETVINKVLHWNFDNKPNGGPGGRACGNAYIDGDRLKLHPDGSYLTEPLKGIREQDGSFGLEVWAEVRQSSRLGFIMTLRSAWETNWFDSIFTWKTKQSNTYGANFYRISIGGHEYICEGKVVTDQVIQPESQLTQYLISFHKNASVTLYRNGQMDQTCYCQGPNKGIFMVTSYSELRHTLAACEQVNTETVRVVFGATVLCNIAPDRIAYPHPTASCSMAALPHRKLQQVPLCDNGASANLACARVWGRALDPSEVARIYSMGPCTSTIGKLNWLKDKTILSMPDFLASTLLSQDRRNSKVVFAVHGHHDAGIEMGAFFHPPDHTFTGCNLPVRYVAMGGAVGPSAFTLSSYPNIIWDLVILYREGGPPKHKPADQLWFGITKENEGMIPGLDEVLHNKSVWKMDFIMSYKSTSDFPMSHISRLYLPRTEGHSFRQPVPLPRARKRKMFILYNNCRSTPTNRPQLIQFFSRSFPVESRGECFRTHSPLKGEEVTGYNYAHSRTMEKVKALEHYMFDLVIENAVLQDYVTNKVYQALYAGAIPVYLGAPNVEELLPCRNCIINLSQFETVAEAAAYLQQVSNDTALLQQYHAWRHQPYNPLEFPGFEQARRNSLDTFPCRFCHAANSLCSATCDEKCHTTAVKTPLQS